jgi:hypothetical protein
LTCLAILNRVFPSHWISWLISLQKHQFLVLIWVYVWRWGHALSSGTIFQMLWHLAVALQSTWGTTSCSVFTSCLVSFLRSVLRISLLASTGVRTSCYWHLRILFVDR